MAVLHAVSNHRRRELDGGKILRRVHLAFSSLRLEEMPKAGGHFEVTFAEWWCSDFSGGLEGVQKVFMHDPYSVPTKLHSGTTSSHLVNNGSLSSAWMSSLAMLTVMENQHRAKAAETNWFICGRWPF